MGSGGYISSCSICFICLFAYFPQLLSLLQQSQPMPSLGGQIFHKWNRRIALSRLHSTLITTDRNFGEHYPTIYSELFEANHMIGKSCIVICSHNPDLQLDKIICNKSDNDESEDSCTELLHDEEWNYMKKEKQLSGKQTLSFIGGRLGLRRAISLISSNSQEKATIMPILRDSAGAPLLPENVYGSISHKGNVIAAVAATPCDNASKQRDRIYTGVGVDIEFCSHKSFDSIGKRLFSEEEAKSFGCVPSLTIEHDIMLRFSAKESLYKVFGPFVKRYVGFKEIQVFHDPANSNRQGSLTVVSNLVCGNKFETRCDYKLFMHDSRSFWVTKAYGKLLS